MKFFLVCIFLYSDWILNIYSINLRIQSKYRKIRARKNSVFGHFSRSAHSMNVESCIPFSDHLMSRQCIANVLVDLTTFDNDLIIKTTFKYFGCNRYNTNRSIILFFVSVIFFIGQSDIRFNTFIKDLRQILRNLLLLALISWLRYHLIVQPF